MGNQLVEVVSSEKCRLPAQQCAAKPQEQNHERERIKSYVLLQKLASPIFPGKVVVASVLDQSTQKADDCEKWAIFF